MKHYCMPDPGEGLTEAEVVSWRVAAGDSVEVNDVLCEVETAKSIVELPSPFGGVVARIAAEEGDTVPVGGELVSIDDGSGEEPVPELLVGHIAAEQGGRRRRRRNGRAVGSAARTAPAQIAPAQEVSAQIVPASAESAPARTASAQEAPARTAPAATVLPAPAGAPDPKGASAPAPASCPGAASPAGGASSDGSAPGEPPRADRTGGPGCVLAKPPARRLAKDLGIDLADVQGTGPDGVVTRTDVKAAAQARAASSPSGLTVPGSNPLSSNVPGSSTMADAGAPQGLDGLSPTQRRLLDGEPTNAEGTEHRVRIQGVRKVTAQAMKESIDTKALVTSFITCDVSRSMELVDKLRKDRRFSGLRVSPLTLWCRAACLAMTRTPVINARWDDENGEIVYNRDINLGIAAATPRGLMVPVLRGAQDMNLYELAAELTRIIAVAKEDRLTPADYSGGTFSISNVGVFGLDAGTPVVNRTESALLVLGTVARRPWVIGKGDDEKIVPRWVTTMSLGFDHRLVDGEQGSTFLHDVAEILSEPDTALMY